jgi:hypothetical protein
MAVQKAMQKVSIMMVNGPSNWPSLSDVVPELLLSIQSLLPQAKTYNIFNGKKPPISDELWIFPVGMVQADNLLWLRDHFKSPYARPRIIFFLGGEGAKLGHHLYFFRDVFRIDDEWIVSSVAEENLINAFFPDNQRTKVLHYPVAKQFVPAKGLAAKKKLRKELVLPQNKPVMVYAGRISMQKNIVSLLDVLEKFKSLHLVICGEVDSLGIPHFPNQVNVHQPALLVKEIAKRKLSERIEFRGFLSQDNLRKVMQASDYQISLSSHYGEDFGYSIAQGLACGLKTVLSAWGGHLNWKKFFSAKELTYVALTWEKEALIGRPVIEKVMKLPVKTKNDFNKAYRSEFREQLKSIIFPSDYKNRKTKLMVSSVLSEHWEEVLKTPRHNLFLSPLDPCFKVVKDSYSGN